MVTGDAVLLDVRPAGFASRAVSGGMDLAAQVLVLVGLVVLVGRFAGGLDPAAAAAASVAALVTAAVLVPVTTETLTRGRTLGKLTMGMRTVRDDGGPIRFRHALVRGLVGFVEIWMLLCVPALLC